MLRMCRMCAGLQADDGTKMTLIGGLMYNGGPGANTSMHGLAAMVPKLRAKAGSYVYARGFLFHP